MNRVKVVGIVVMTSVVSLGLAAGVLAAQPASHTAQASARSSSMALAPIRVNMVVVPDSLRGSDKQLHDAFLPTNILAKAGQEVIVTVYNLDQSPHSFTSAALGVNAILKGGPSNGVPGITTFSFTAHKAGTYQWLCVMPCDNGGLHAWAMTHRGYMTGNVIVTSA